MKLGKMIRFGNPLPWRLLRWTVAGGLLWSLVALAEAPPVKSRGRHGAAAMEDQLAELQKLQARRDLNKAPTGFDPVIWAAFIPEDNKLTSERVALGRKLYFDTRLSRDGSVACATCHDVTRGFTDGERSPRGSTARLGKRNAPTTLNATVLQVFFWDGRAPSLEHQAGMPILNPVEMGMPDEDAVLKVVRGDRRLSAGLPEGLRPGGELRRRGAGPRGLRADAGVRRLALPAVPRRRCQRRFRPRRRRGGSCSTARRAASPATR